MRADHTLTAGGGGGLGARLLAPPLLAMLVLLGASCAKEVAKPSEPRLPTEPAVPDYITDTVGEKVRFIGRDYIAVQGYGFVTGLDGTGSTIVPPGVRQQVLFIMRQHKVENPEALMASRDTAVITVGGMIPPGATKGEAFDLELRVLPGTDATSLEGGFLLECDLTRVAIGRTGELRSQPMALARGDIFVGLSNPESGAPAADPRIGRILAGGRTIEARRFRLILTDPSVRAVDQIIRQINARFPGVAKGTRDARVDLTVPDQYQDDKTHFLDLVGAIYLREMPAARDARVKLLIDQLEQGKDMDRAAIYLEAFGGTVIPQLRNLADHPNESVRFYVGRILAFLQDGLGQRVLEPIALNDSSEYQEAAVRALGEMRRGLGLTTLSMALDARSARVRIAAWRAIRKVSPAATVVAAFPDRFTLSAVPSKGPPFVYVSRSLEREIAVFGDVRIQPPALARTQRVMATASPGAKALTIIAGSHDQNARLDVPLDLVQAIRLMASPVTKEGSQEITGLDLNYSQIVAVLYQLAEKKALTGPMVLQPLQYYVPGGGPIAAPPGPAAESDAAESAPE